MYVRTGGHSGGMAAGRVNPIAGTYEEAKYNAAFDRCVDVMSQMLQKYGHQVLDKLEQDAPQGVEHSEESNQAQLLTDKAA